ncbi:helix-turn-helix domain-containing protein [Enterobacter mori]|uniref:hypothetical protein n=1 Tax=Enterobacter mori TaxID=539813 RepID=UPI00398B2C3E
MKPMKLDVTQTKPIYVSEKLLHSEDFYPEEKLYLMELINIQRKGMTPYLSQSQFAKRNKKSRPTINKMVKNMVDKGYIINLGQKEESLACDYIVNVELMQNLGYVYVDEPIEAEVITNVQKEEQAPLISKIEEDCTFNIEPVIDEIYDFLSCNIPAIKNHIRAKLTENKFYKATKGREVKVFTIPGYEGEL